MKFKIILKEEKLETKANNMIKYLEKFKKLKK